MSGHRVGQDLRDSIQVCDKAVAISINARDRIKPLFRWAGGKQQILRKLVEFLPTNFHELTYREPFLGAGSLFFCAKPDCAVLSDLNADLIRTYESVVADADLISRYLREHAIKDSEDHYYEVRDMFNSASYYTGSQAARFIYLNRTCFNGIYRVNEKGDFNVPYGKKDKPIFPDVNHLRSVAAALTGAELIDCDFETALEDAGEGDFVYLDPPYPALNGTSYFTHYTVDRFDAKSQERLAEVVYELDEAGCRLLMSNADTPTISKLYRGFDQTSLGVPRYVTSKSVKHEVSELIITNF